MVVCLCLIVEEAEACREEGLQISAAEYMQQWKLVLVGSVCVVHQEDVWIHKQQLNLLLMGKEEIVYMIICIFLNSEDLFQRGQVI